MSERDMYDRALGALERKRRELQRQKAERAAEQEVRDQLKPKHIEEVDGDEEEEEEEGRRRRCAAAAGGGGGRRRRGQDGAAFAPSFIECATFAGTKDGYIFKRGPRGTGYYRDGAAEPKAAAAKGRRRARRRQGGGGRAGGPGRPRLSAGAVMRRRGEQQVSRADGMPCPPLSSAADGRSGGETEEVQGVCCMWAYVGIEPQRTASGMAGNEDAFV